MGKGSLATVLKLTQTINGASFTSELDANERFGFTPQLSSDGSALAMLIEKITVSLFGGAIVTDYTISLFKKDLTTDQYDTQNVHIFNDINDYAINNYVLNSTGQFIAISYSKPNNADSKVDIFKHQNDTWVNYGTIQPSQTNHLIIGWRIALSDDGNTIALGNPYYSEGVFSSGKVFVYEHDLANSQWVKKFEYIGFAGAAGTAEGGDALEGGSAGASVSLNGDGTILAIGEPTYPDQKQGETITRAGRISIFKKDNGTWSNVKSKELKGTIPAEELGSDVSLNSDGTIVMIGSYNEGNDSKKKYIFDFNDNTLILKDSFDLDHIILDSNGEQKSAIILKDIAVDNSGTMVAKVTRTFEGIGYQVTDIKYDISLLEYINGAFIKNGEDISNIIRFDPNLFGVGGDWWEELDMLNGISLSGDGKTIAVGSLLHGDHGELKIYRVK